MRYLLAHERKLLGSAQLPDRNLAALMLRMLQRRFGLVSEDTKPRVRTAKAKQLGTWSLNILDAATLGDVFQDCIDQ